MRCFVCGFFVPEREVFYVDEFSDALPGVGVCAGCVMVLFRELEAVDYHRSVVRTRERGR